MPNLDPTYLRYIDDNLILGSIHPENASELPEGLIGLYEEAFEEHLPIIQRQQLLQRVVTLRLRLLRLLHGCVWLRRCLTCFSTLISLGRLASLSRLIRLIRHCRVYVVSLFSTVLTSWARVR